MRGVILCASFIYIFCACCVYYVGQQICMYEFQDVQPGLRAVQVPSARADDLIAQHAALVPCARVGALRLSRQMCARCHCLVLKSWSS